MAIGPNKHGEKEGNKPRRQMILAGSLAASFGIFVVVFLAAKKHSEVRVVGEAFEQTAVGAGVVEQQRKLEICATDPKQCGVVMEKLSELVLKSDQLRKGMESCLTAMKKSPEQCRTLVAVMEASRPAETLEKRDETTRKKIG